MVPVGFGPDLSFCLIPTCHENVEIEECKLALNSHTVSISTRRKAYEHFSPRPFLVKCIKFQVCTYIEITRGWVNPIL